MQLNYKVLDQIWLHYSYIINSSTFWKSMSYWCLNINTKDASVELPGLNEGMAWGPYVSIGNMYQVHVIPSAYVQRCAILQIHSRPTCQWSSWHPVHLVSNQCSLGSAWASSYLHKSRIILIKQSSLINLMSTLRHKPKQWWMWELNGSQILSTYNSYEGVFFFK